MAADISLVFLIDRISRKKLALFAAALSAAGLLFYGCTPWLFSAGGKYGGILAATVLFAFAGGLLEIVLTGVADSLPQAEGRGGICLLHTAYAWAQVALSLALLAFVAVFGAEKWNFAVLAFALVPLAALLLLARAQFPPRRARAPVKATFKPFYLFAALAVFFGYGTEIVMNQWISSFASETFGEAGGMLGCAAFAVCLGVGGAVYVSAERRRSPLPRCAGFLRGCFRREPCPPRAIFCPGRAGGCSLRSRSRRISARRRFPRRRAHCRRAGLCARRFSQCRRLRLWRQRRCF